jgi:hypothetical protein
MLRVGCPLAGGRVICGCSCSSEHRLRTDACSGEDPCRAHPCPDQRRISGLNMMCAFGVPGYMTHGASRAGVAERPVDAAVANGM